MAEPQIDPLVGITLKGKWSIDARLATGGMATVYAATHRNGKRVAIKMLRAELSHHAETRERFLREGYTANAVQHQGVVCVDDDDVTDDGRAFLVMELLEGETLDTRLRRQGPLPPAEVLACADQLLDVLAAAHEKGIVHRDIKPENLFLTSAGRLKLLDFGIARHGSAGQGASTQIGSIMGTPAFMAPEQARARWDLVDGRTDLWAVGATMYTLLSMRYVREGGTPNEELAQAMGPAPSLAVVAPELPGQVVELVDRAMAYDLDRRWQSAAEMQHAVRVVAHAVGVDPGPLDGSAVEAPTLIFQSPEAPRPRPLLPSAQGTMAPGTLGTAPRPDTSHPRRVVAAAAVVVACLGLVVWWMRPRAAVVTPPASAVLTATPTLATRLPPPPATAHQPVIAPAPTASAISVDDLPDVVATPASAASSRYGFTTSPRFAPRPGGSPASWALVVPRGTPVPSATASASHAASPPVDPFGSRR